MAVALDVDSTLSITEPEVGELFATAQQDMHAGRWEAATAKLEQLARARPQDYAQAGPVAEARMSQRAEPAAPRVGGPIPEPAVWTQVLWLVVAPTGLLTILLFLIE
jgi:hypothetical protein